VDLNFHLGWFDCEYCGTNFEIKLAIVKVDGKIACEHCAKQLLPTSVCFIGRDGVSHPLTAGQMAANLAIGDKS
jgi:hypothetical protein